MATENKRTGSTHFYFEAVLAANEKLVLPTPMHTRRNGDFRIAVQAANGTKIQATLAHPGLVASSMVASNRYASTVTGDYPAIADAPAMFRWNVGTTITTDWDIAIVEIPATALLITAPAGGTHIVIHGDF